VPVRRTAPAAASHAAKAVAVVHPNLPGGPGEEALPAPLRKPAISAAELAFMDGWTALRQGRHQDAAASFSRAAEQCERTGNSSLLEDARFWRAVSLARSGQRQPAIAALRDFLGHHPAAARFGEATVILGFQLLRNAQLDEAQRCFESAASDSHPQIRENARAGLAAVAARR
jgi:TolA-binding protein